MLRIVRDIEPIAAESVGTPTDPLAQLAVDTRAGNPASARTLLTALAPTILRAVRGVLGAAHPDVSDIAQDVAIAFLEALPNFRGECSLRHFASRIAVLRSINARRQNRFRARFAAEWPAEDDSHALAAGISPAEIADAARCRRAMNEVLGSIPEPQAEALVLHFVLGHTVEEIAIMAGVPVNTVRSRLRVAKSALRERVTHGSTFAEWQEGSE